MVSFVVDGPLVGAVRVTQKSKWTSEPYRRYAAFKKRIRILATAAGVPLDLKKAWRCHVSIEVHFNRRARIDLDNLIKSTLDGCWKQDRRVTKIEASVSEGEGREWMRVWVSAWEF